MQKWGIARLTIPPLSLWLSSGLYDVRAMNFTYNGILTELLKKSLLVNAAVPATSFPAFARLEATPLTVSGSGRTSASVSVTLSMSYEIAEGGAMIECGTK